jgi:hypothetical protein
MLSSIFTLSLAIAPPATEPTQEVEPSEGAAEDELATPEPEPLSELEPEPVPEPEPEPVPEPEPEPVPAPVVEAPPAPIIGPPPVKRLLPRGVEIDGLVLGTGLIVAGGVMLAFDEKCVNRDADPEFCSQKWESTAGGALSIGLGGALMITSVVLLVIDERRVQSSKKQVARFELGRLRF